MEPKCGPKASRERSENRPRLGRRLGAVLEPEKGMGSSRAAEWRRAPGGGKGGGLKPCKELSHLNPTRPCARWAGGFKGLTPFRRPPGGVIALDDRGSCPVGFSPPASGGRRIRALRLVNTGASLSIGVQMARSMSLSAQLIGAPPLSNGCAGGVASVPQRVPVTGGPPVKRLCRWRGVLMVYSAPF